jgi:hypothetical protein
MHSSALLSVLCTTLSVGVLAHPPHPHYPSYPHKPARGGPGSQAAQALYTITNLVPNEAVAIPVSPEGCVGEAVFYPTGGDGAIYNDNFNPGHPVPVDALLSQDAVIVRGNVSSSSDFNCSKLT